MKFLFYPTVAAGEIPAIPGLRYVADYVSETVERELVAAIDGMPWNTEWKRRRQPYGDGYGNIGNAPPLPAWAERLGERMLVEGITSNAFDQMLVNEYEPGQGISLHRDYEPYGRTVVSLSLLSHCVMDFHHVASGQKACLLLEPRSLLVLSDEARYDWEHGIAARKRDVWQGMPFDRGRRLSVTYRFRIER